MRLLWSSRSPFARKVMVAAHELGLAERLELERVVVATDHTNPGVMAINPLNQIPTLVCDDGSVLFDSSVIVDFLNTLAGSTLVPAAGDERWRVLRLEAVGDGLAQVNRARLAEARRGAQASPVYEEAFRAKTGAILDWLEANAPDDEPLSVGSLSVAVALAHLDFRFPEESWRDGRPRLASWHDAFCRRPSMRATEAADVY